MPQIENWSRLPPAIRAHLVDRMRDRKISVDDLNRLRLWVESKPDVPEGRWYKDFASFKLCGERKISENLPLGRPSRRGTTALKPHFIPSARSTRSSTAVFPSFFV